MLIDTHIHLDAAEFAPDRAVVIDAARGAGVQGFVVPGVTVAGLDALDAVVDATPGAARAYGVHPMYVEAARQGDLEVLDARLARPDVVAVGEIGLDGFVSTPSLDAQRPWFEGQLALARKHDLPVVLHVRRAVEPIIQTLRRLPVPGGIAHAFNGSRQQAETLIAMGFKLGFGGTMSYAGSTRIHALARDLPLSALVLETDAPDIPPEWARGQRNEAANIARYAHILAELRREPVEDVVAATGANALAALPRLAALVRAGSGRSSGR